MRRVITFSIAVCLTQSLYAADDKQSPRYSFSWPLSAEQLQPRGGSTRGAPVQIDDSDSPAWKSLQEKDISTFERDRRAILAMAGTYRVTFDFLEIARFNPALKLQPPYQSWGTEKIYVDVDDSKFISLVHILEMRIANDDGTLSEPFVTKHWRQDWRYEPTQIVEYVGNDRWRRRDLTNTRGLWSQTVYQVDESPRYASIGQWQHSSAFSTWLSGNTARPLPRREWSVRNDYQILLGTNRHTITAHGWIQEENNLKTVIDAKRAIDVQQPYLAREYGVARYERIRDEGFVEADRYFERTRKFWDEVRDAWSSTFARYSTITLRGPVDKLGLFEPLFAQAEKLTEHPDAATDNAKVIDQALGEMGVPRQQKSRRAR